MLLYLPLSLSSTEEVIALFISIAFVVDALKGTVKSEWSQGQTTLNMFGIESGCCVNAIAPRETSPRSFVTGNVARQMHRSIMESTGVKSNWTSCVSYSDFTSVHLAPVYHVYKRQTRKDMQHYYVMWGSILWGNANYWKRTQNISQENAKVILKTLWYPLFIDLKKYCGLW